MTAMPVTPVMTATKMMTRLARAERRAELKKECGRMSKKKRRNLLRAEKIADGWIPRKAHIVTAANRAAHTLDKGDKK